jgi:hypothetical protein
MEFGTLIFTKPQRAITDPKLAKTWAIRMHGFPTRT